MLIHDPAQLRLGRKARAYDPRTLRFAEYLTAGALPATPKAIDYGAKVKAFGMLKNDEIGDCTIAGVLHANMIWKAQNGAPVTYADAEAVSLYSQLCGYDPKDPATDQGGIELNILKAWRKAPIGGVQLDSFVSVNPRNWQQVKAALFLFGTLYMGLSLPVSAQNEEVWASTKDQAGGWGGHCVVMSAYADRTSWFGQDTAKCITWGAEKTMTRDWIAAYCDELYALLSPAWLNLAGQAPNGFNIAQLRADLARV